MNSKFEVQNESMRLYKQSQFGFLKHCECCVSEIIPLDKEKMEICYAPSLFWWCLLLFYFILFVNPFVFSTTHFSNRHIPRLSNASDQQALLAFKSAITYDPYQSLATTWKTNVSFCQWTGIICSRRRHRVVSLNVSSMALQEYGVSGQVTTNADVYSFGIVLLEMLTGKKPTHDMFAEGLNLQKWVSSSFPNRLMEVVDIALLKRTSSCIEEDKNLNCLSSLINVGFLCTNEDPQRRPTMMVILSKLQNIRDTFLNATAIPKVQSNITLLLSGTSTTLNHICESQSSSTF